MDPITRVIIVISLIVLLSILSIIEKKVFKIPKIPIKKRNLALISGLVLALIVMVLCYIFNQDYVWGIVALMIGCSIGRIYFIHLKK